MEQVTITLNREDAQRICNALITEAVQLSEQSKTIGVDCMHPDFYHRLWNDTTKLWCKVYEILYPETEKED